MRIELCKVSDVPEGTVRRCDRDSGPPIAVYNVDGEFYATDDVCTHGEVSLSEGVVDGDIIECPMHGGAFEIKTGQPAELPCVLALRTYRVTVDGDRLMADVDS